MGQTTASCAWRKDVPFLISGGLTRNNLSAVDQNYSEDADIGQDFTGYQQQKPALMKDKSPEKVPGETSQSPSVFEQKKLKNSDLETITLKKM